MGGHRSDPFTVGLITFFVCLVVLSFLVPTVCNDGWASPSIGRQGACSWHGGVNNFPGYVLLVVSFLIARLASNVAGKKNEKRDRTLPSAPVQIFRVGAQVYHPAFGLGEVVEVEGDGPDTRLFVNFKGIGRKLHLDIARAHGLRVILPNTSRYSGT
jgi:hypothetical protein